MTTVRQPLTEMPEARPVLEPGGAHEERAATRLEPASSLVVRSSTAEPRRPSE